jgi:thymidylate synthase (FAD)
MTVIKPSFMIETPVDGAQMLRNIERYARTCYKSEGKATETSAPEFVRRLLHVNKHAGIIEHEFVTVRIICDRGVSHELVRHRLASYLQESTRYCNYKSGVVLIAPCFWAEDTEQYRLWYIAMMGAERVYVDLLAKGATPQQARSVLPNSVKTEVVMTANLRSWRNVFQLRTAPGAHPSMREIMVPLLNEFKSLIPVVFDDITPGGSS